MEKDVLLPPLKLIQILKIFSKDVHASGFVAQDEDENTLYIMFQSTVSTKEVNHDLQYTQVVLPNWLYPNRSKTIRVHKGFLTMFKNVKKQIDGIVKGKEWKRIIIGGHSLGGAIASLLTLYLYNVFYNDVGSASSSSTYSSSPYNVQIITHTFGKPRVGNNEYTQIFHDMIETQRVSFWRMENSTDIFTHLPTAVVPDLGDKTKPYLYHHEGISVNFSINMGSIHTNHGLTTMLHQEEFFLES